MVGLCPKKIMAYAKHSNEAFELYFEDGELLRIRSYDNVNGKSFYDEYKYEEGISKEHFIDIIKSMCIQDEDIDFEELLFCLRNDEEYLNIAKNIISDEIDKMSKRIEIMSKAVPNKLQRSYRSPRYYEYNYLTPEQIRSMKDEELVLVSRIAINSQLAMLGLKIDDEKRKAALQILLEKSKELESKEAKRLKIHWGAKMTIKEIKTAFGKRLDKMSRTYFRKISK